jgi:hypothetical protein
MSPNSREQLAQPLPERHPAALNADQYDFAASFIPFRDFVGDTGKRALNRSVIKDKSGVRHNGRGEV